MNKNTLKSWIKNESKDKPLTKEQEQTLIDLWDLMLFWSGSDEGFYSVRDLAKGFGVSSKTIYNKIKQFKKLFPEAYDVLKEDRARVQRVCRREGKSFRNPLSWEQLREDEDGNQSDWEPKIIRRW